MRKIFHSGDMIIIALIIIMTIVSAITYDTYKRTVRKRKKAKHYCEILCRGVTLNDYYRCSNQCYDWRIK